ncbi:MAG: RseA family anti-sigma factor [Pseudoxanthomonas sp.]
MNHEPQIDTLQIDRLQTDKFELHYRQQLSALMDGDLAPDQARFLLRRMQHDEELNAQWERWQLLADVLRGQALAPAPAGFAARVSEAIAAEAASGTRGQGHAPARARGGLLRWGGALAASFAVMALFVGRQQLSEGKDTAPADAVPATLATASPVGLQPTQSQPENPAVSLADAGVASPQATAAPIVTTPAIAAAKPRSATRNQQAARVAAVNRRAASPQRAVAGTMPMPAQPVLVAEVASTSATHDPFANAGREAHVPAARPWPRSTLPGGNAFSASYGGSDGARTFYPFEPRLLPESPPVALPVEAQSQD